MGNKTRVLREESGEIHPQLHLIELWNNQKNNQSMDDDFYNSLVTTDRLFYILSTIPETKLYNSRETRELKGAMISN